MTATPRPRRLARTDTGFSLIEVAVALIVFAIGVLALAICIPMGSRKITRAGQQTRASTLAAQQAEELLMTPYGDNALIAGTHYSAGNPVNGSYYLKWAVVDSAPVVGCKRVTVSVSRWSATKPSEASVTIVCPVSD
jgi:prepilin-type N-terminal cleavage/methylation domain-containing protein